MTTRVWAVDDTTGRALADLRPAQFTDLTAGRLGVAAGGAAQTVQVTFNVTTPDAQSFSKSEAQVTAMLARAVGRGRRGL